MQAIHTNVVCRRFSFQPYSGKHGLMHVKYDLSTCQQTLDEFVIKYHVCCAGMQGKVSHYVFVGSAGAYVPRKYEAGHVEGDERKASAGHVEVENYLEQQDVPYTVFQPLYIYGPHTAKVLRSRSIIPLLSA